MKLTPGLKLQSAGSTAAFIVIRTDGSDTDLTCAGAPLDANGTSGAGTPAATDGAGELLIGKRYRDARGTTELLCTQSGPGPLLLNGHPLAAAAAKSLPSSD
ncbi:hypothetical protein [Streptomyces mirabilis]|uniref:hypothetical protein n=1 Tax=Streptomyces mirabilis TaxID=68239 RepID=UPI0033B91AAC